MRLIHPIQTQDDPHRDDTRPELIRHPATPRLYVVPTVTELPRRSDCADSPWLAA
jgi:hypothetical protein